MAEKFKNKPLKKKLLLVFSAIAFSIIVSFLIYRHVTTDPLIFEKCIYEFVLLERQNLPVMSNSDFVDMKNKLGNLLDSWKRDLVVLGETIVREDIDEFINRRAAYLDGGLLSTINIFNPDMEFLEAKVSKFSKGQRSYAFKGEIPDSFLEDIALLDMYLRNLDYFKSLRDSSGRPIIKQGSYAHSYSLFCNILPRKGEYKKVFLSNNILIDDAADMPVHTFIRGGFTNGFCDPHTGNIFISIFPQYYESKLFNNTSEEFKASRTEILAIILAHEIGHCCFGLRDIFNNENSIMQPGRGFDYMEWVGRKGFE